MASTGDASWGRRLAHLAETSQGIPLVDATRRLLSLAHPLDDSGLARRLLAAAVGVATDRIPDWIGPTEIPALLHGPGVSAPLERASFVVVDLETTGLSLREARILEIGAVRVTALRRVESFQRFCDPEGPIPDRITRLTGIDARAVEGAPALDEALGQFRAWLARTPGAPFVAHNASFDERFVTRALDRAGLEPLDGPVICTRKLARRLLPELGRYGLDMLCAHFGIANASRHRALGDAEATARALIELLALARSGERLATLGDLLALQERRVSRARRRRPRGRVKSRPNPPIRE